MAGGLFPGMLKSADIWAKYMESAFLTDMQQNEKSVNLWAEYS